ncbi:MAG TPA: cell division protein FtsZ [Candidatus Atribacteria bacterium]|nr:MAG: cell division protein FtsZ [Candidatus Aenigmarchaeota archaeon]HDK25879.1 cell division protein FtsZ [Candidatus Atribacteria bacterium]
MVTKKKTKQEESKMNLEKLLEQRKAIIKVVGVGGAGNNTATRLVESGASGAEVIGVNTDAQQLLYCKADKKILLGKNLTRGLGAGADPAVGEEAAKENKHEIEEVLKGADMVFVTCGLGGGTGTGSIPIIAETAKKMNALTVGVVTMPFTMEGKQRTDNALMGLDKLEKNVDTLIVIPNDKLLEIVPEVSITTAFKIADEVLVNAVRGITDLVMKPGLVNLDFADLKAVMKDGGLAMIGLGSSDTENKGIESVERALNNPLLDMEIDGAKGALINISGGKDITIKECQEIVERVSSVLDPNAKIIWGATIDKELGDAVKTLLVVTGITSSQEFIKTEGYKEIKKKEVEKVLGVEVVE